MSVASCQHQQEIIAFLSLFPRRYGELEMSKVDIISRLHEVSWLPTFGFKFCSLIRKWNALFRSMFKLEL